MGWAKACGMRWIPYRLQQQVFRVAHGRLASKIESLQRFGSIDWPATLAYSEELNYFPAVWLNCKGREPHGTVDPDQAERVSRQVSEALRAWRDPLDGAPVVQRVRRREEVYRGPEIHAAPDLILELNRPDGYSYALGRSASLQGRQSWRRLEAWEYLGFKGGTMNGSHRSRGVFMVQSRRPLPQLPEDLSLSDLAPMILDFLDIPIPVWMDRAAESKAGYPSVPAVSAELSRREEDRLRRRLINLGYLG
jgi:predicted AlkP superfamily phosphohydrolase/phosphomutase